MDAERRSDVSRVIPGTAPSPSAPARPPRYWVWPAMVVSLLALHGTAWLAFTWIAVSDPSFAVEPDHYSKSLAWDQTAAELRESRALGWAVEISAAGEPTVLGERRFACRLRDRDGTLLTEAAVDIETFHHARGNERIEARLAEESPGNYVAVLPIRKPGLWECRLTARRGEDTFRHVVTYAVKAAKERDPWRR